MRKATMTVLPGLGHIPQIEDPAAFTQALTAQVARMR
jgi:pimeloyl-ACP methyl ester carboxylesterase